MKEDRVFQDKIIRCCDCGESFKFSAGEQAYYYERGLKEPRRCPSCRELRKRAVVSQEIQQ